MSPCDDPYHCNCFVISPSHSYYLQNELLKGGYHNPLQEDHGQIFGLAANVDETMQFHIKVMPKGQIEAEIEPQTQFLEHLNQNYSTPAHFHVQNVLDSLRIPYQIIQNSIHCMENVIRKPPQTTSVIGAIIAGVVIVGLLGVVLAEITPPKKKIRRSFR